MIALYPLFEFKRLMEIATPTTPRLATIVSVESNRVTLNIDFAIEETDTWSGGIVQITDATSTFNRLYGVIVGNNGSDLILEQSITAPEKQDELVGKQVTLSGGPLQNARIYVGDPDDVSGAFKDGVKYLVVINITGGSSKRRSLGRRDKGIYTSIKEYDYEIACETKDITKGATQDDVFNASFGLTMLHDQVVFLAYYFFNCVIKNMEASEIEDMYISYSRPGSDLRLRGIVSVLTIKTTS